MAQAGPAPKVKLICGMISSREELFTQAREGLSGRFGPCDIVSEIMPFDLTHYYDQEMGSPLYRQFIAFERLVDADVLVAAKVATNEMEWVFKNCGLPAAAGELLADCGLKDSPRVPALRPSARTQINAVIHDTAPYGQAANGAAVAPGATGRPINLDPGYIEGGKLVLASMKNFSHRIYMGHGVFGEVTMQFRHGTWEPLPWTFPDYGSGRYFGFLNQVRERLMAERSGVGAREGGQ
jgi:hypothetical protein